MLTDAFFPISWRFSQTERPIRGKPNSGVQLGDRCAGDRTTAQLVIGAEEPGEPSRRTYTNVQQSEFDGQVRFEHDGVPTTKTLEAGGYANPGLAERITAGLSSGSAALICRNELHRAELDVLPARARSAQ
jgi:hypothetical protein